MKCIELIPPPDFTRTHKTKWVEEQDRETYSKLRLMEQMRSKRHGEARRVDSRGPMELETGL